nr:immunoglobulin heavy chain junction region [Macaca mulatta]MOX60543.1 immunoglobulin heavy chain junction region [Macaca mulatta]MOX66532.1 immunoglobulin heavy chain junction region [Macaca mulatta]MOX67809.1 immunoglobulin heavy chain junction region [Macaca mulatta]
CVRGEYSNSIDFW